MPTIAQLGNPHYKPTLTAKPRAVDRASLGSMHKNQLYSPGYRKADLAVQEAQGHFANKPPATPTQAKGGKPIASSGLDLATAAALDSEAHFKRKAEAAKAALPQPHKPKPTFEKLPEENEIAERVARGKPAEMLDFSAGSKSNPGKTAAEGMKPAEMPDFSAGSKSHPFN
jgi:hypothetical protein